MDKSSDKSGRCRVCGVVLDVDKDRMLIPCNCGPKVLNRTVGAGRPKPRRSSSNPPPTTDNIAYIRPFNFEEAPEPNNELIPTSVIEDAQMANVSNMPINIFDDATVANHAQIPSNYYYGPQISGQSQMPTYIYDDPSAPSAPPMPQDAPPMPQNAPPMPQNAPPMPQNAYDGARMTNMPQVQPHYYDETGAMARGNELQPLASNMGGGPQPNQQTAIGHQPNLGYNIPQGNAYLESLQSYFDQPIILQNLIPLLNMENQQMHGGNPVPMEYLVNAQMPIVNAAPMNILDPAQQPPAYVVNGQTFYGNPMQYNQMQYGNDPQFNPAQVPFNYGNINPLYYTHYISPQANYEQNFGLAPNYMNNMPNNYNAPANYALANYGNNPPTAINYAFMNYDNDFTRNCQIFPEKYSDDFKAFDKKDSGFYNMMLTEEEGAARGYRPGAAVELRPEDMQIGDEARIRTRKQRAPKRYIRKQIRTDVRDVIDVGNNNKVNFGPISKHPTLLSKSVIWTDSTKDFNYYLGNRISSYGRFFKYTVYYARKPIYCILLIDNTSKEICFVVTSTYVITNPTELLILYKYGNIQLPCKFNRLYMVKIIEKFKYEEETTTGKMGGFNYRHRASLVPETIYFSEVDIQTEYTGHIIDYDNDLGYILYYVQCVENAVAVPRDGILGDIPGPLRSQAHALDRNNGNSPRNDGLF